MSRFYFQIKSNNPDYTDALAKISNRSKNAITFTTSIYICGHPRQARCWSAKWLYDYLTLTKHLWVNTTFGVPNNAMHKMCTLWLVVVCWRNLLVYLRSDSASNRNALGSIAYMIESWCARRCTSSFLGAHRVDAPLHNFIQLKRPIWWCLYKLYSIYVLDVHNFSNRNFCALPKSCTLRSQLSSIYLYSGQKKFSSRAYSAFGYR